MSTRAPISQRLLQRNIANYVIAVQVQQQKTQANHVSNQPHIRCIWLHLMQIKLGVALLGLSHSNFL